MPRSNSRLRKGFLKSREVLGLDPLPEEQLGLIGPDEPSELDLIKSPQDGELRPVNLAELYMGPGWKDYIRDQGRTNRCTGFAGALGMTLMMGKLHTLTDQNLAPSEFSANFAYWFARRDKAADKGAFMRDLMSGLHKNGVILGRHWTDRESPVAFNNRLLVHHRFRLDGYERVLTGSTCSVESFQLVLSVERLPIFVGMMMHDRVMRKAVRNGRFEMPENGDRPAGGHAMLIVGWFRHTNGRVWFITINSWGRHTGDGGVYFIPEEAVRDRIVLDAWTANKQTY
jgi:hypothetical protein